MGSGNFEDSDDDSKSTASSESGDFPLHRGRSCCRHPVCLAALLALAVGLVLGPLLLTRPIGGFFAQQGIRKASIEFESINIGTIRNSSRLRPHIVGRVKRPSPVTASFSAKALTISAQLPDEGLAVIGHVALPELTVEANRDMVLNCSVDFFIDHEENCGRAGKNFVIARDLEWLVKGSIDVTAYLFGIIPIPLRGIPFEKKIGLKGMGGFSQATNPINMTGVTHAVGKSQAELVLMVQVMIYNPSFMAGTIASPISLNITQRGYQFGVATLHGMHFEPGTIEVPLKFVLQDTDVNKAAVRAFLLSYIQAEMQIVSMRGSAASASVPFLSEILDGLDLEFQFKPPRTQFIQAIVAHIGISGITATAQILNPLPQEIIMGDMDLSIRENNSAGAEVFSLDTRKSETRIPGQVLRPSQVTKLILKLSFLDAKLTDFSLVKRLIAAARAGRLVVGVRGPIVFTIAPAFQETVAYIASNIEATLQCAVFCGTKR